MRAVSVFFPHPRLSRRYQIKYRRVDPERRNPGGHQEDSHGFAPECAEIEKRWSVVGLVLVLYFALLVLQVQDRSALGMVERGAAVKGAEDKGKENHSRDGLQTESPSDFTVITSGSLYESRLIS